MPIMVAFGNAVLLISAMVFLLMCNQIFFTKIPAGDAGVGYAWSLILGVGAFSICLAVVTAIIGSQGGFGWVIQGHRTLLVIGGLILILTGNGFFSMGEYPVAIPVFLQSAFKFIPALLPPLLLFSAAILLNGKQVAVPAIIYKLPIFAGLCVGIFAVGILILANAQTNAAIRQGRADFHDSTHQKHLDHIDTTDVMKNGVFLYVYTDANHADDVREKALAKIKSRPDWQAELVRRLQNDWAAEAFTFLASNEVDNKTSFPEAVNNGILIQAKLIRESIQRCQNEHDLYEGRFVWEVERVLRTVDKFEGMGVNYRPAVQELRIALDEPTVFEKPGLTARDILEKWLKEH